MKFASGPKHHHPGLPPLLLLHLELILGMVFNMKQGEVFPVLRSDTNCFKYLLLD